MKYFLTYILLTLSNLVYSQCDIDLIGGSYRYGKSSDTLEVVTYLSTDTLDNTVLVLDFYDKPDTVFVGMLDNISRYTVDFNINTSKSYRIRKIICYAKMDNTFLLKVRRNHDRVKWVYIDKDVVLIKHKHNILKKCVIRYPR